MRVVYMHSHLIKQKPTIKINTVDLLVNERKSRMRLKLNWGGGGGGGGWAEGMDKRGRWIGWLIGCTLIVCMLSGSYSVNVLTIIHLIHSFSVGDIFYAAARRLSIIDILPYNRWTCRGMGLKITCILLIW